MNLRVWPKHLALSLVMQQCRHEGQRGRGEKAEMCAYVKMEERTMQCGTACTKDCRSLNAEEERNYENKEASKRREKEKKSNNDGS